MDTKTLATDIQAPAKGSGPEPATLFSYLVFPLMLGGGLVCTYFLGQNASDPMTVAIVVSLSSLAISQAMAPFQKSDISKPQS